MAELPRSSQAGRARGSRPAFNFKIMGSIRVLVADDSALMRQTLKRIMRRRPGMEFAGIARDGEDAVAKARELRPDVVTMDINMPKLDGITALQMILDEKICPVVMVSSLTQRGAATTFECLELGAFDFVAKPDGTVSANMGVVAAGSNSQGCVPRLPPVRMQRVRKNRRPPPCFSGTRAHSGATMEHHRSGGGSHRDLDRRTGHVDRSSSAVAAGSAR